jgi:hypothetical protein
MDKTVTKSEFKPRAFELFRYVETTNKALIISDHGKPVLRLSAITDKESDQSAAFRNTVTDYIRPLDPAADNDWEVMK